MENRYKLKVLDRESLLELFGYKLPMEYNPINLLNRENLMEMGLKYGIIYNFDKVESEKIKDIEICFDNIMEARFFNEEKEIRVFREEEGLKVTIFLENNSPHIKKSYILYPRYREKAYASKIDFKEYIDYDEDNQGYIRYIKPSKLHFKEGKR